MKIYLVGGAVRDTLLGIEPKDRDYVVVGSNPAEMEALGYTQVGADFPVFLHPESGEEYALARIERKTSAGYNGFAVDFDSTVTLEQDLSRRDLTINSMAMDLLTGDIIDPFNGMKDLKNKMLRHTSEAFAEDPVRVLRVARFAARYEDFKIATDTARLMREIVNSGEFNSLTPERVWAEFAKGLCESKPSRMLNTLIFCGADKILAEFFHGVSFCTANALDRAATNKEKLEILFAITARSFETKQDYLKWTIPSSCAEISTIVNNEYYNIIDYNNFKPQQKIEFFNRVDLFRRKDRFLDAMKAVEYIAEYEIFPEVVSFQLMLDIESVLAVNAGEIALAQDDKSKIKQAIFDARVAAIK